MSASTKLSTSVKALCYLAEIYPKPCTSKIIAGKIGVNPSKLRKLLSLLSKNGIILSTQGINGGFQINKDPGIIHLQEIYCSVEDRKAFHLDSKTLGDRISSRNRNFNKYFLDLFADVQVDIENKMRDISLLTVMENLGIKSNYKQKSKRK